MRARKHEISDRRVFEDFTVQVRLKRGLTVQWSVLTYPYPAQKPSRSVLICRFGNQQLSKARTLLLKIASLLRAVVDSENRIISLRSKRTSLCRRKQVLLAQAGRIYHCQFELLDYDPEVDLQLQKSQELDILVECSISGRPILAENWIV